MRDLRRALASRYDRLREAWFDRRFGIQTQGEEHDLAALGASGRHLAEAYGYEPVQLPVFRAILRAAQVEPGEFVYVDFGSGKGRALLLAAEHGFRRAVGVELAPRLHEIAERNAQAYRRRRPGACPIELHCGDAADFALPAGKLFLSFYNPFGETVLRKVVANIEDALRAQPREIVVAYRNPVHAAVLDAVPFLRALVRNRTFVLYKSG